MKQVPELFSKVLKLFILLLVVTLLFIWITNEDSQLSVPQQNWQTEIITNDIKIDSLFNFKMTGDLYKISNGDILIYKTDNLNISISVDYRKVIIEEQIVQLVCSINHIIKK